ncbi:ABC transporter ATP-binding protein [Salinicola sp. DM10]|uniref:ABC transporter ATP-binding protein n=1 Tax=Salinicola sp. DM10 TaxID=2815721 RepID=UPI001A8F785E|nr:ABC transporter ATP-binding protein [Salinicola sp. DM10]MCE3026629.1 ABC transporter ATP-binding protein [Salinicola sp. DM10]
MNASPRHLDATDIPVIRTRALSKRYGPHIAVEALDLDIAEGEIFGLLGPNGAGKTTTILMLLGLTEPSGGDISVVGLDPRRRPLSVKRRVGYLPDTVGFYDDMSGRENLGYSASLMGWSRRAARAPITRVLERVGLTEAADRRVAAYSRGMRQRLGLAELLLKEPQVAILDEPTLGLDPEAATWFLATIRDLKQEGMTILLSSHLLAKVQTVCDRVGLFHRGRMAMCGSVAELADEVLGVTQRVDLDIGLPATQAEALQASLLGLAGVQRVTPTGNGFRIETQGDLRSRLVRRVIDAGGDVHGVTLHRPGLEEIYQRYFEEASNAT